MIIILFSISCWVFIGELIIILFIGENDTMLAVALGNVAHLVYMMANFLQLPLRYPILVMGSRSSVVDVVTDKLTDKERQ